MARATPTGGLPAPCNWAPSKARARRCGEPVTRQFLGYREVIDYYGGTTQVPIEEWSYGPRNGMYYYLRFEANRLITIESKRGQ